MSLSDVIKQLPSLTQGELKTLKAAIEELTQQRDDEAEPMLYDVVRRVIGTTPPYNVFKANRVHKSWLKHVAYINAFMAKNFTEATKVQRLALMTFVVRALAYDLKHRHVPVTVTTMARNLGRFAQVFESEFPNYIASGMQSMILKALKEKSDG